MKTITIKDALELLTGFRGLVNFTMPDGKVINNWFGLDHMKIAANIRELEPIERSFTDARNALIKNLTGGAGASVPPEKIGEFNEQAFMLMMGTVDVSIRSLNYERITAGDNKIQVPALVALWDYIDGKPDSE